MDGNSKSKGNNDEEKDKMNINFSPSAFSPFSQTKASNFASAATVGVGDIFVGCACATALIAAAPIKCGIDGYSSVGIVGAVAGVGVGAIVGSLAGVAFVVGGVFSCVDQVVYGLARTPEAVLAGIVGNEWDPDTREFINYNLQLDAQRTLVSEEEFLAAFKRTGSLAGALKGASGSAVEGAESEMESTKSVADRTLYDILGVEPNASASDIKKSYYIKARQHHPDRNRDDPEAHQRFQKIGEAYQVLSDPKLRAAYDSRGREVVEGAAKVDAAVLYAVIFGSDKFESIIGELHVAGLVRAMTEPGTNLTPELIAFRQRQREVSCAMSLATKLDTYATAQENFSANLELELRELTETPLGAVLLGVVGSVYEDCALEAQSYAQFLAVSMRQSVMQCVDSCNTMVAGSQTAYNAIKLQQLMNKDDTKEEDGTQRGPLSGFGPGANASPAEKEEFLRSARAMGASIISLLWQVSKADIQQTLRRVCRKVLQDHSVSPEQLESRRSALLKVAEAYKAVSVDTERALEDLLNRVGAQSGLFQADTSTAPSDSENQENQKQSDAENNSKTAGTDSLDTAAILGLILRSNSMGTKELITGIDALGGSERRKILIEKNDLRIEYRRLLLERLKPEELHELASGLLEPEAQELDTTTLISLLARA